jgi:large subunit ribosomal protein L29
MTIAEIRELTPKELAIKTDELRQEIFHFRLQQQAGQLERPHLIKTARRQIARLQTIKTHKTTKK